MQQQPTGPMASSGGMDKRTGAIIAYVLGWITGIIMLFVGKNDPDIKFHAAQSVVFFGSLTVINIVIGILSAFINPIGYLSYVVDLVGFIFWIIALVKSFQENGARFQLPLVGGVVAPYAEQLAAGVR